MNLLDYRKQLGIGINDAEKNNMFRNKICNLFLNDYRINDYLKHEHVASFFERIGEVYYDVNSPYYALYVFFNRITSTEELLFSFVIFLNCMKGTILYGLISTKLEEYLTELKIPYDMRQDGDGVYYFPKGVPEMDLALVSTVCDWLNDYPKTKKLWEKSLKEYAMVDSDNASVVADLLRKSLETFFKEFFEVSQSLENCKAVYGKFLKEKGIPKEIANNFEILLCQYSQFNNEYAKHNDKTSINVLEYLLYQTGNTIRLLITLHNN